MDGADGTREPQAATDESRVSDRHLASAVESIALLSVATSGIVFALLQSFNYRCTLPSGATVVLAPIVFSLTAICMILLRLFTPRLAGRNRFRFARALAFVGLGIGPLGFGAPIVILPIVSAAIFAIGIAAASLLFSCFLCKYTHIALVTILSSVAIVSSGIASIAILLNMPQDLLMVVSSVFDILALIFINDTAMDTPFMGVTSEQSKLRATTRKIDRVTYAIIGLNVGFSTGLALSGYIVTIRFQNMNVDASLVVVFLPLLLAGFTLLLFRNKYQYLIEHISKEYLSACVVACLLAIVLLPEPAKVFFLALLIFFADVQLLIAINAGIEFIVFERLSPVWYITEYGIIMLGAAIGVIITSMLMTAALDFQRLTLLCALIAVVNVALQPTINRGRYPLPAALTSDSNSRLAAQQMVENDLDQTGESNVVSNSDAADSKLSPPPFLTCF